MTDRSHLGLKCVVLAIATATLATTSEAAVCPGGVTVQGVDVSSFQGAVDWPTVKAGGISFAYVRLGDGDTFIDPMFATNWSAMKAAGLIRGAYQTFEPAQSPVSQANLVVSTVGLLGVGDLPVVADMELTGGESAATIAARLETWVTAVGAGTGKTPVIYTADGYWNGSVGSTAFGTFPLWVADWGVACPTLPDGWSNWAMWQYSDSGTVSGITGAVDVDEFNGNLAALQQFSGTAGIATPAIGNKGPLLAALLLLGGLLTMSRERRRRMASLRSA